MSEEKKTKSLLDKWTLFKVFYLTTTFLPHFTTYPRFYGTGFAASILPAIKKLYKDRPEEIIDAMQTYGEAYYLAEPMTCSSVMSSVGVDVGRLGTMVVAGQPKTNAEYIQATSRVGRDNPGLVITVYNPTRSRDRSHYEQFLKYHSAMYRYVEATSLTPFADRARDRGLHALYVSLCRYLVPEFLSNDSAAKYNPELPEIKKIKSIILDYVERIDPGEFDAVIEELQDIEDEWSIAATGALVYRSFKKDDKKLLKADTENSRFRTMNSMRSVDAQAGIYLLGR